MTRDPIQVGDLCRRLGVPYRDVRYVLERRHLPEGVEAKPGHGHHRQLTPVQAFWLAIVLKLKAAAVSVPRAVQIADFAKAIDAQVGRWSDRGEGHLPFLDQFEIHHRWFVDVGDLKYVRMATDADPAYVADPKNLANYPREYDWEQLDPRRRVPKVDPAVILRVNLTRIAGMLRA